MQPITEHLGKASITVDKNPWSITKDYRKLTVVLVPNEYRTYISRKDVPAGTVLTNKNYWIPFSSLKEEIIIDHNRAVAELQSQIDELKDFCNLETQATAYEIWGEEPPAEPKPRRLIAEVFSDSECTTHPTATEYYKLYVKFYEDIVPTIEPGDEDELIYEFVKTGNNGGTMLSVIAHDYGDAGINVDVTCAIDFATNNSGSYWGFTIENEHPVIVTVPGYIDEYSNVEPMLFIGYTKFYSDGSMEDYVE